MLIGVQADSDSKAMFTCGAGSSGEGEVRRRGMPVTRLPKDAPKLLSRGSIAGGAGRAPYCATPPYPRPWDARTDAAFASSLLHVASCMRRGEEHAEKSKCGRERDEKCGRKRDEKCGEKCKKCGEKFR